MVYKFDIIGDFLIVVVSGNGYLYQVVAKVVKVVCQCIVEGVVNPLVGIARRKKQNVLAR